VVNNDYGSNKSAELSGSQLGLEKEERMVWFWEGSRLSRWVGMEGAGKRAAGGRTQGEYRVTSTSNSGAQRRVLGEMMCGCRRGSVPGREGTGSTAGRVFLKIRRGTVFPYKMIDAGGGSGLQHSGGQTGGAKD